MQRSDLKFAPALCTMLVFGVLIHPFVLNPWKFPFLYHSLGDEWVCSLAARSATRRWLWDVSGFAKVPGISLQMLNMGPWSSFPFLQPRHVQLCPCQEPVSVGLWVEPAWPHAAPLSIALSRVAKWGNATADVTAPYGHPRTMV